MRFSELEEAMTNIATDKQSGANALTLKVVDIYIRYIEQTAGSHKAAFLRDFAKLKNMLKNVQPSMVSIRNVIDVISQQTHKNKELTLAELRRCLLSFLEGLKADIANAKSQIAHNALSCIPDGAIVITLSKSSTVEEVIRQAYEAKKVSKVIVAESRPLCEGLNFAERLLKLGVPVTVIVDAALGFFCKDSDLAIVGADTVQSSGSVIHKVGTYPLALACHDLGKPFYVACDTLKISKTTITDRSIIIETNPPDEVITTNKLVGVDIKNVYFDITPSKYLTAIITEKGFLHLQIAPALTSNK